MNSKERCTKKILAWNSLSVPTETPFSSSPTALGASAILGECAVTSRLLSWGCLLWVLLKFISSRILAQSPEGSFQEESMELPNFILLSYCLFKEQSSKIKISSAGKKNWIQAFLRTESTTFPSQTKQSTTQHTKLPHVWSLVTLTMNEKKLVEGKSTQKRDFLPIGRPEWPWIGCIPGNGLTALQGDCH